MGFRKAEDMQGSRSRMGGRFYVIDYQVHDKLVKLGLGNSAFYRAILRNAIIAEDWETGSEWVLGKFSASTQQLMQWAGLSRGPVQRYRHKLIEAKLLVKTGDNSYALPWYKRKSDEGIRLSDIKLIQKKLEQMEQANEQREIEMADMRRLLREFITNSGLSKKPAPPQDTDKPPKEAAPDPDQPDKEKPQSKNTMGKTIAAFYASIGEESITHQKRGAAQRVYNSLLQQKYSHADIAYITKWTIKNAEKTPYSFALVGHTASKAMSAKKAQEEKEKALQERDREKAEEINREQEKQMEEEERREKCETYKESMGQKEREELKKKAREELKQSEEIPDQFINDILIEIKENEILRTGGKV